MNNNKGNIKIDSIVESLNLLYTIGGPEKIDNKELFETIKKKLDEIETKIKELDNASSSSPSSSSNSLPLPSKQLKSINKVEEAGEGEAKKKREEERKREEEKKEKEKKEKEKKEKEKKEKEKKEEEKKRLEAERLKKAEKENIDYFSGIYSNIKNTYIFEEIIKESKITLNDNDIFFICFNKNNKHVISFYTIDSTLEIGNAYTLKNERNKGYSKQIAINITEYVIKEDLLCYIFTEHEYIKKIWEETCIFYTVINNSNNNKFKGLFYGLNGIKYDLDKNYYVLRNNNCTSLFIFHNTSDSSMKKNRITAEKKLENLPKYNKLVISFEKEKTSIKGLYKIDESYNDKNYSYFYKYIKKNYTEIKYINIFLFGHGNLLPENASNIGEKKFYFGETSNYQSTNDFVNLLNKDNNYFILMGSCSSNYFIDELNMTSKTNGRLEKKPSNIIALSLPSIGDDGSQINTMFNSLDFINEYRNSTYIYNLKDLFNILKSRQLVNVNNNNNNNTCPFGIYIQELIITYKLKINETEYTALITYICNLYKINLKKYTPLENEYKQLIDDAYNKINEIVTIDIDVINKIKERIKSFLDRTNESGINNSNIYIGDKFSENDVVDIFCKKKNNMSKESKVLIPKLIKNLGKGNVPPYSCYFDSIIQLLVRIFKNKEIPVLIKNNPYKDIIEFIRYVKKNKHDPNVKNSSQTIDLEKNIEINNKKIKPRDILENCILNNFKKNNNNSYGIGVQSAAQDVLSNILTSIIKIEEEINKTKNLKDLEAGLKIKIGKLKEYKNSKRNNEDKFKNLQKQIEELEKKIKEEKNVIEQKYFGHFAIKENTLASYLDEKPEYRCSYFNFPNKEKINSINNYEEHKFIWDLEQNKHIELKNTNIINIKDKKIHFGNTKYNHIIENNDNINNGYYMITNNKLTRIDEIYNNHSKYRKINCEYVSLEEKEKEKKIKNIIRDTNYYENIKWETSQTNIQHLLYKIDIKNDTDINIEELVNEKIDNIEMLKKNDEYKYRIIKKNREYSKQIIFDFRILYLDEYNTEEKRYSGKIHLKTPLIINEKKYNLVGKVIHNGTSEGGHYVANMKYGDNWYLYDDMKNKILLNNKYYDNNKNSKPVLVLYEREDTETCS